MLRAIIFMVAFLCLGLPLQSDEQHSDDHLDAAVNSIVLSGNLGASPIELTVTVATLGNEEIEDRERQLPLFGANAPEEAERQRVMKSVQLKIGATLFAIPAEALIDLLDPAFVHTLRLSKQHESIVVSWAGGSGERAYRCLCYANEHGFYKREVFQLDNTAKEQIYTKTLQ